ncbi:MAG: DUF928 domain-containing protein [Okeania sp. SIO3I5]|uniref:DUF928 domain-containing protein n=1 Tax=Okeania sp. SIO3I5 TaxID=2607805 RepID=UPI0013BADFE1|nr:DUF928 domain-containing protein [Okeania sp. SIO3I5]NEQ40787.1 DUF928 domain-containing protein [Okeania sp. SIO3I5]
MKYLLLIASLSVTTLIKLWSISAVLERPVLAITTFRNISSSWKISQTYKPPDRGAPPSTESPATRGPSPGSGECLLENKKLTLLLPETKWGLTISKYPTLYVYIPPYENAQEAEFFIRDSEQNDVYNHVFKLPEKSGIIRIKLPPEKSPPLEVGKNYSWEVKISCISEFPATSVNPSVEGKIKRILPEQSLYNKLAGVTPLSLPTVYASQGIWYDALESMVELRRLNPDNPELINDWEELFNSANSKAKEELIQAPILDCCQKED